MYPKAPSIVLLALVLGCAHADGALEHPATTRSVEPEQQVPQLVAETGRSVPALRGGNAQPFQIASAILKETRRVLIVLPAAHAHSAVDQRYPVTVVFDGEHLTSTVAAVSAELARNGQIPETVIVGIENVGGTDAASSDKKRVFDLTPLGLSVSGSNLDQGGDLFLDFIEKELLPAVDRQFRTAAPRILVGHSSGGVLATYAAATRSTFGAVVALDAPIQLSDGWLAKKLIARAGTASPAVRYASLEARFGWPQAEWKSLTDQAPATWKLYREQFQLEGHDTMQMLGAYIGLRQVFGDYSRLSAPLTPTTGVLDHYAQVSASLGAPVLPPRRVLQGLIDDLIGEGRGAAARRAHDMLVSGYGPPADDARLSARITAAESRPSPAETIEGLLATAFPTPEAACAYLGEWTGDILMKPEEPRTGNVTLRIRVVDGHVIGETVRPAAPAAHRVQRWEYMRITPAGMTWGNMNGMQPRAVVLFEGKLEGDTLSGTSRFGGIDVTQADGSPPPPLYFSLTRVRK